jgi:hypothetical protein
MINDINTPKKGIFITESVLPKNINRDDILKKYTYYLGLINSENSELIIIDPYIFPESGNYNNEYISLLKDILHNAKAKHYIIITKSISTDNVYKNSIVTEFNNIEIYQTDLFHDRIWISNRNKGFFVGTSLNGIGRKVTLIDSIASNDVKGIVNIILESNLFT